MKEEIKRENKIVFLPCQSTNCQKLQNLVEEEAGEFELDNIQLAFLKLFNVKTALPPSNSKQLFRAFLDYLRDTMGNLVVPEYYQHSYPELNISQAKGLLFDLLTEGTAGGQNIIDDKNEARQIIQDLFNWCGRECYFYTNWTRRYAPDIQHKEYSYPRSGGGGNPLFDVAVTGYSGEEGLIFVSSSRAGIFWFFGED